MRDQFFGSESFSQQGDDLMILNIFWLLGIKHPSYLDIGAHHPRNLSNTALMYKRGSIGVNVEANPNLMDAFYKERPLDKNICIGVGPRPGPFDFFMIDDFSGRNTFVKEEAEKFIQRSPNFQIREVKKISMVTLQYIVDKFCDKKWPDFLSIDVEGLDHAIMSQVDFKKENRPKVICIESTCENKLGIKLCMSDKDYFLYCRTGGNLIFCQEEDRARLY